MLAPTPSPLLGDRSLTCLSLLLSMRHAQIKGDLSITSRDHMGNTTDEFASTASATLLTIGSRVVVGGDVLIQSGDALVAETGAAAFRTDIPALALADAPSFFMSIYPTGETVVGGNVPSFPLFIACSKCLKACIVMCRLSLLFHQVPSPSSQALSRASATMATAATMPVQHPLTWLRVTPISMVPSRASPYREVPADPGMCVLLQQLPIVMLSHHTLGWRIGGTHEAR
jgi:hypothetical protein